MPEIHDLVNTIKKTLLVPVHPAGWPFICGFALGTVILFKLSEFVGFIGLILTVWCVYFFRNPPRTVPQREGLIVSPADGVVLKVEDAPLPAEIDLGESDDPTLSAQTLTRISIFLNVFDVHVNRVPAAGTISQVIYHPGKFFNASLDKASEDNERSTAVLKLKDRDDSLVFVQIAGLVARRIINELKEDQTVEAGDVYGIIRFGSRADIYLPPGVNALVIPGQRMIGGESVLADLKSREKIRQGVVK